MVYRKGLRDSASPSCGSRDVHVTSRKCVSEQGQSPDMRPRAEGRRRLRRWTRVQENTQRMPHHRESSISSNVLREPQEAPNGPIRRGRFVAGVTLIAASFLVYPAYSIVPFLPLSDRMKIGVALLGSLLSWGAFYAGIYLSGREGYDWLRQRWTR